MLCEDGEDSLFSQVAKPLHLPRRKEKKKHQELCLRIKRLKFTKQTLLERMRLGEQVLNIHILPNIVKQYEIYVYSKVPDSLTWH